MHAFRSFFGGEPPGVPGEKRGFVSYFSFLRSTPRLYADARASLAAQIAKKKRAITESKPLASQLAGASAAWERAKAKVEKAEGALATAIQEVENAKAAEATLATEVMELQARVTQSRQPDHSITSMMSGMTTVLEDM